jgi:hypothetical protein
MKQFNFLASAFFASTVLFFLPACNSGADKKTEEETPVTTTEKTPEVTTPKLNQVLFIEHKIADYAKWKPVYDSHDSIRRAHGLSNYIIGRGMDDPNMVLIILKMDDATKAKELSASPDLKDRMQKAGVTGKPNFTYLQVVMNDDSQIEQTARVIMSHKVKDWDAWKKEFDSHKQARMDAGLIDRGVGYSVDDNHDVNIVFAITDMQKAKAFMSSKDLKDKMTAAGVEGPPKSFFYNIVEKF